MRLRGHSLKDDKRDIRTFIRRNCYSDEKLALLLDHARSGNMSYFSCCCLVGLVNADHPPLGHNQYCKESDNHLFISTRDLHGAAEAELAFTELSGRDTAEGDQALASRRLIPIVLAEIKRRTAATVVWLPEIPDSDVELFRAKEEAAL